MKYIAACVLTLFASFASAEGLEDMSAAERDAFRAEVRAYLLENPEVILEAIDVLEQRQAAAEAASDRELVQDNLAALQNDGVSFVGGNPDGTITIVEFLDYRCGYCKRSHPEVQALLAENDDIRLIVKEFPILGPDSLLASQAATAVLLYQPDLYKAFSDGLMAHNGPINEKTLADIASESGVDANAMLAKTGDDAVAQVLRDNHELAQTMRISGTPTFVIGPEMIRGFIPQTAMQQMVDQIRQDL